MTPTDEELDEKFWLAFNDILQRIGERSFNQQKRAYDAWLGEYVPLLEARGRSEHALEARRRVAEMLVHQAISDRRPAAFVERLLHDIEALGWSNLYRKEAITASMCRYFSERMWNQQGLHYLLPLRKEVEAEYARTQAEWWSHALRSLHQIEERLRARRRQS